MIILKILAFLITLLFATSCSSGDQIQGKNTAADDEPFYDPPATVEAEKREAVFVYKDKSPHTSRKLTLKLNGEPVLLASGYVRLAGVVSGGRPIALIEVGGRALALRNGDTFSGYQILNIVYDQVSLRKKEEKECGR